MGKSLFHSYFVHQLLIVLRNREFPIAYDAKAAWFIENDTLLRFQFLHQYHEPLRQSVTPDNAILP